MNLKSLGKKLLKAAIGQIPIAGPLVAEILDEYLIEPPLDDEDSKDRARMTFLLNKIEKRLALLEKGNDEVLAEQEGEGFASIVSDEEIVSEVSNHPELQRLFDEVAHEVKPIAERVYKRRPAISEEDFLERIRARNAEECSAVQSFLNSAKEAGFVVRHGADSANIKFNAKPAGLFSLLSITPNGSMYSGWHFQQLDSVHLPREIGIDYCRRMAANLPGVEVIHEGDGISGKTQALLGDGARTAIAVFQWYRDKIQSKVGASPEERFYALLRKTTSLDEISVVKHILAACKENGFSIKWFPKSVGVKFFQKLPNGRRKEFSLIIITNDGTCVWGGHQGQLQDAGLDSELETTLTNEMKQFASVHLQVEEVEYRVPVRTLTGHIEKLVGVFVNYRRSVAQLAGSTPGA